MLSELFHYFSTPCPSAYRRLGYLSGLIAIQSRFKRVGKQWEPHLENSRQLILQASTQAQQYRKVVVLGSGLLKDVPVNVLAEQFASVILIDVAHLIETRRLCKKLGNVIFLEHDMTGLADAVLSYKSGEPLPRPNATLPDLALGADLIISCNMLSQIAIAPSHYLRQHFAVADEQLVSWQIEIIENHLALLSEQPSRRVLLCDVCHDYMDSNGVLLERENILRGVNVGEADQQWPWLIAPLGELNSQYQLQSTVFGFSDWGVGKTN